MGLDHRQASVETRGRLNFAGDALTTALHALRDEPAVDEAIILSTCNRTEIYLASGDPAAARTSAERLLDATFAQAAVTRGALLTTERTALADLLYTNDGVEAATHLHEVAAGLRSMVIGEPQILGQTRAALAAAEQEQVVGEELRALFTSALKIGKRVRTETDINRADVSVAGLGVRAAREALGDLRGKTALLIGAGRTNQLSGALLRAEQIGQLLIANRSLESAAALASRFDGQAVPLHALASAVAQADLIISATAAPHVVLDAQTITAGRALRAEPLVVVDLAAPGDVAAEAGALPGVTLLTLDTLREMADFDAHADPAVVASLQGHARDIERSRQIIAEGMRDYTRALTLRLAVPGIAALRRHVDRSEEQELAQALAQLDHLSDRDRAIIERFGSRLVDKMFHHLVRRIRSLAEYDEIPPDVTMRVLAQLFAEPPTPDRDSQR
ncbi:MAG TPA: glutamyl-tRNA reductase [Ktedonobacterales bacterium]